MDELIARIETKAGIDAATARKAAAIVVKFVAGAAPPDRVNDLLDKMPGAREMMAEAPGGGSGIMGAFNDLTAIGLDMGGVQAVTAEFIAYAKERAGDQVVDDVVNGIPGLSQFV